MEPQRHEIGADVYRTTTIQGPFPPFESAWSAVKSAHRLFWQCMPSLLRALLPVLIPLCIAEALIDRAAADAGDAFAGARITRALDSAVSAWTSGVTLYVAWERLQGRAAPGLAAMREGARVWWLMWKVHFRYGLMVLFGFLAFVVPGIYLTGKFALAEPSAWFERMTRSRDAMARSATLTSSTRWRTAWAMTLSILLWIVYLIPVVVLAAVSENRTWTIVVDTLMGVTIWLILAFLSVVQMVIYLSAVGTPMGSDQDKRL